MTTHLDVLVVENHRHAADGAAAALVAAGHRVHRCYDRESRGFPCRAIVEPGSCPIDHGVDVALVVRDRIEPRPTRFETGVSCALRAGVPVVEKGVTALDPFGPWLSHRIAEGDDLVAGVEGVAQRSFDELRRDILTRIRALLPDRGTVDCRFQRDGQRLVVHLDGPALGDRVEKALAVRVLDAVRDARRSYGPVDVAYHERTPDGAAL